MLLFRDRFAVSKPLSQIQRRTISPLQDADPTPSFGGFGLKTGRYSSLTQNNSNGPQIDLLEEYGRLNRAAPLYCLYNFSEEAEGHQDYHCRDGQTELKELGCTVTPSSNIRQAIDEWGAKNFKSIHSKTSTLPWQCLVSCPMVQLSLEAMAKRMNPAQVTDLPPLFDPTSCYHPTVPMALRRDGSLFTIRENENGGSLISIHLDAERDIEDPSGRPASTARDDFSPVRDDLRERHHRDAGLPRTSAVVEAQSATQTL